MTSKHLFAVAALIVWWARTDTDTPAHHTVLGGGFISIILMASMSLYGVLQSEIDRSGWMAFGYFLFGNRRGVK